MRSCVAAVSKEEDSLGERITVLAGQVTPVGTFRWHGSRWRGSQAGAVACCWLKNGGHWRHWRGDRARRPRQRPVCLGAKPRSACAARAGQRRTCAFRTERRQNRLKWAEPGWIPWCVLCSVCSVLHPKQVLFTLPANTRFGLALLASAPPHAPRHVHRHIRAARADSTRAKRRAADCRFMQRPGTSRR